MKQEHEMYSNHVELLLSIHFLTGESGTNGPQNSRQNNKPDIPDRTGEGAAQREDAGEEGQGQEGDFLLTTLVLQLYKELFFC